MATIGLLVAIAVFSLLGCVFPGLRVPWEGGWTPSVPHMSSFFSSTCIPMPLHNANAVYSISMLCSSLHDSS